MIGTTLSRYRITAKLGEGGMGSVWLAEDTLLGRSVALKLLAPHLAASESARQRFVREARAASRLEHSGIAAVYDAGEAEGHVFIAYQLVDGETLARRLAAGPLPLPELLRLACGSAEALAHAHEREVLHRDLTAGNVMLRADGAPVIVDFGLARTRGDVTLTTTGTTLGTAPYLAPEQWRGEAGDARTDLWSLGVVLYFAATGQQPFGGDTPEAVMYRVMNDEPVRPTKLRAELPAEFERLVLRLLEKDAQDRPASAAELAAVLRAIASAEVEVAATPVSGETPVALLKRWWRRQARRRFGPVQVTAVALGALAVTAGGLLLRGRLATRQEQVLAVLPMRNTSRDAEETAHIGEALGEELVRRLGASGAFRVLPWVTTSRYSDLREPLPQIAHRLHADVLLMGTYQDDDEQLSVHAELVDGRSGLQLWSDRYARPAPELIQLQTDLATAVSRRIAPALKGSEQQRIAASAPTNPEAYEFYIRGANYWHAPDPGSQALAEPFFEKAVGLDSTIAEAWVGLGALRTDRYYRGAEGGYASLNSAESCFKKALALSPNLPLAERGLIRLANERSNVISGQIILMLDIAGRALQRDPENLDELQTAAWGFTLGGQASSAVSLAVPVLEHALRIDSGNQAVAWYRVVALSWSGLRERCLEAGKAYIRAFGEDPEMYTWMGQACIDMGRLDEGILYLERAVQLIGNSAWHYSKMYLADAYAKRGDKRRAELQRRTALDEVETRFAASPDNIRLAVDIMSLYTATHDLAKLRELVERVRAQVNSVPGANGHDSRWISHGGTGGALAQALAKAGHPDEARQIIRSVSPDDDREWFALDWTPEPGDTSSLAFMRSEEVQAFRAAVTLHRDQLFNKYRAIVVRALPDEPDVPKPRAISSRNDRP